MIEPLLKPHGKRKSSSSSLTSSSPSTSESKSAADAAVRRRAEIKSHRHTRTPYQVLLPLVRMHFWAPDGKPPAAWDDRREGSVLKRLLAHRTVSQIEVAILGLAELRASGRIAWLKPGQKVTSRALYNTRSGVSQMFELATNCYWQTAKARAKKPMQSIGDILYHVLAQSDGYRQYIKSDAWRARRERALLKVGRRCERCPEITGLEVHHLNYENLGHEPDEDLEVLCWRCHKTADRERAGVRGIG
jgi:hypothetical protein